MKSAVVIPGLLALLPYVLAADQPVCCVEGLLANDVLMGNNSCMVNAVELAGVSSYSGTHPTLGH